MIGAAAELGWSVLIAEERHSTDRHRQLVELAGQVDALVGYVYADRGEPDDPIDLDERNQELSTIPLVRIDPVPDQRSRGVVILNMRLAAEQAIERLADHGVRHPVVIDNSGSGVLSERAELFLAGWLARGVEAGLVVVPGDTAEHGVAATARTMKEHPDVDAVMCFNDVMAFGALGEFRRRGVAVPDQVRVIGVDGLSVGSLVSPTLTTLAVDLAGVARQAVTLAVGIESGELPRSGPTASRSVSYRLLVRESG